MRTNFPTGEDFFSVYLESRRGTLVGAQFGGRIGSTVVPASD